MKIEYLIDKDAFKTVLKNIDFTASNKQAVGKRSLAYKGKTNYLFQLTIKDESDAGAIALSEVKERVDSEFFSSNINYQLLTDEASQYFGRKLFPLVCEFETKLRKFIQSVLFDLREETLKSIIKKLKDSKIIKNDTDIKKGNLLELSELGWIIDFLFSNDELAKEIKDFTSNNRNFTRDELTALITNSNKHTVWEDFFENDFSDSTLQKIVLYKDKIEIYYNNPLKNRPEETQDGSFCIGETTVSIKQKVTNSAITVRYEVRFLV